LKGLADTFSPVQGGRFNAEINVRQEQYGQEMKFVAAPIW
jgi:hypothetical protein